MKVFFPFLLCPLVVAFTPSTNVQRRSLTPLSMALPSSRRSFLEVGAASAMVFSIPHMVSASTDSIGEIVAGGKIAYGDEAIMSPKEHGTSALPVQSDLLYGVPNKLADRICNFNRHFAETGGFFQSTNWEKAVLQANGQPLTFYDSVTGKPLFVAPIGRSASDLIAESEKHGWPSFRDEEVVWENVRVLRNSGETVSVDGTHLGHNLPDRRGNRYCINLVSISGKPSLTV